MVFYSPKPGLEDRELVYQQVGIIIENERCKRPLYHDNDPKEERKKDRASPTFVHPNKRIFNRVMLSNLRIKF
jgi:hypothetical protein